MAYSELTPAYPAASEAWVNDWRLISFAPHTPSAIRSGGQVGPADAVGCDGPAEDGTVEAEAENELGPPPADGQGRDARPAARCPRWPRPRRPRWPRPAPAPSRVPVPDCPGPGRAARAVRGARREPPRPRWPAGTRHLPRSPGAAARA